jgi:hypothetical protein
MRSYLTAAILFFMATMCMAAQSKNNDGPSLNIGRKKIALVSSEIDRQCTSMIMPFTITDNIKTVFAESTKTGIKNVYGEVVSGGVFKRLLHPGDAPSLDIKGEALSELRRQAKMLNWLPSTIEVSYGQHVLAQYSDALGFLDRDETSELLYTKADRMLADALTTIKEDNPELEIPYNFVVYISKENGKTALALPGGPMIISKPLIKNSELDGYARFALYHELAHVLQRHETRALQARIVDAILVSKDAPKLIGQLKDIEKASDVALSLLAGSKLVFQRHRIDQELQADACSLRLTKTVLADDTKLVSALKSFLGDLAPPTAETDPDYAKKRNLELSEVIDLVNQPIDRHPSLKERADALRAILKTVEEENAKLAAAAAAAAAPNPINISVLPNTKKKAAPKKRSE